MKRAALLTLALGCSSSPSDDVVGPFTGTVHRFVIDSITIPHDSAESDRYAADLDGDGKPENKLGLVSAVLASTNDLTINVPDMIQSAALASVVEIQADDLGDDDAVGVTYFGAEGDDATVAGGSLVAGAFRSNRTNHTRHPGFARIRLPVYTNADPLVLELEGLEIDLDADGAGGFNGVLRGGVREQHARDVAYAGFIQMLATEPERHLVFERQIDVDGDGVFEPAELDDSVIALLVAADIQLFDGDRYAPRKSSTPDSVSLGFAVHLAPCADGRCSTAAPAEPCRDRVRDGDETDVDCGGSCQPCADDLACSIPADCQSQGCDGGRCRAATCSDGIRDGYESDIDCGGVCGPCAAGKVCAADPDCASMSCDHGVGSTGSCIGP